MLGRSTHPRSEWPEAPRDLDRMIQAFLPDGPIEVPDPSYDEMRDRMEHKRQRAAIGPWEYPTVNKLRPWASASRPWCSQGAVGIQLIVARLPAPGGPRVQTPPPGRAAPPPKLRTG